jgi:hypothetical protein
LLGTDQCARSQCWENARYLTSAERTQYAKIKTNGWFLACGQLDSGIIDCWTIADSYEKTLSEIPKEPMLDFDVGSTFVCAITQKEQKLKCWGGDLSEYGAFDPPY